MPKFELVTATLGLSAAAATAAVAAASTAVVAAATPRSSSWPVTRGQNPNITYVFSDSNNWMAWKFACRTSGVDQMNPVWWHKEVNKKLLLRVFHKLR